MATANFKRFKWNRTALYDLRRDQPAVEELEKRGAKLKRLCGDGYEMSSNQGAKKPQGRWHVNVYTQTADAMVDNARNNTILRNSGSIND